MKKYIDIQRLRETDEVIDDNLTLPKNTDAFQVGDIISITEKIDGSNTSIRYDEEQGILRCFSRNNELKEDDSLRGFREYVQRMDKTPFAKYPHYIFFGEWLVKHTIIYERDNYEKWYLFSIFDGDANQWMPQEFVKEVADEYNIPYVHELYYGTFISWDHCKQFMDSPSYGKQQEGIVIKNQTALQEGREPHVLKYVNPQFQEIKVENRKKRAEDPERVEERKQAEEYMRMIVTEGRVMKVYNKLVDEGILPEKPEKRNMVDLYKYLPKRVYDDCVKEEPEILYKAGKYAGKCCTKLAIEVIKKKMEQ